MKKLSIVAATLALGFAAGASSLAAAQGKTVVEPTVTVGSMDPGPESPAAARKEAAAALAEARRQCRSEPDRTARDDCLAAAREDYRQLMASARQASR